MKAIILNSGIGQRMGTLTDHSPKCLVPLSKKETILDYQIALLSHNDINELIITTGPFSDQIKEYITQKYPSLNVSYVHNPLYSSTNYIYSIHLIPDEKIDVGTLLIHGDLILELKLFNAILSSSINDSVLVNKQVPKQQKDFKGRIIENQVREIGVDIFDSNCYMLMPLYKMSKEFFMRWKEEIKEFVNRGETNKYAENAFNSISKKLPLYPHYYTNEFCMEIDTPEDLDIAQKWISRRK
jgi:phosphoenolpyruvate phosphomutase